VRNVAPIKYPGVFGNLFFEGRLYDHCPLVLTDWYSCSSISRWRSVLGRHLALTYVLQLELLNTLCNGVRVTGGATSNENSKCDRALLLHLTLLGGYQIFRLCLRRICNPFLELCPLAERLYGLAKSVPVISGCERARLRARGFRWLAKVAQAQSWEQADLV
jgi:hypothetical protein